MAASSPNLRKHIRTLLSTLRQHYARRCNSSSSNVTNQQVRKKRVALFEAEQKRQLGLVSRVEKIEVKHIGMPDPCTLIMNKDLSTPFNCAMHIQELLMTRSALALVNGEPWDMHRPLTQDCELEFLHFEDEDPRLVNKAFWRTCSFLLGHVLETAFEEKHYVQLCSFPPPNVGSGSFVYDADLDLGDWKLTSRELDCLSRIGLRLRYHDLRIERLDVPTSLAQTMFEDNEFKSRQLPAIAAKAGAGGHVAVYRMGHHVDLSAGPMVASTGHLGRFSVTAVHDVTSPAFGKLSRVQGLAMPTQLNMHSWTYDTILRPRAARFNQSQVPDLTTNTTTTATTRGQSTADH